MEAAGRPIINALGGHAVGFGVIAAKGTAQVTALLDKLASDDATIPATAQAMFAHIAALDQQIAALNDRLLARHKANPISQLLAEVPGIGPLTAIILTLTVQPGHFASGRHFAAWLGLTPKEHSTGGHRLGWAGTPGEGMMARGEAYRRPPVAAGAARQPGGPGPAGDAIG